MRNLALMLALAGLLSTATAAPAKKKPAAPKKTAQQILAASPASDWRGLDAENTLLMELGTGQVIIELAPRFAPAHAANIRALARGGYWDGLAVLRVQDNFVTQWGDPNGEDATKAKPLPTGANAKLPAEFSAPLDRVGKAAGFAALPDADGWAPRTGFMQGFPVAADPKASKAWLAHCYGMVGAGRGDAVDSSNGAELYVVIGQAPRGLDLNITLVGRVLKGMELLSALPRGTAAMGFYDKPEQRTGIQRVRLLAEVPAAERPALQVLKTESSTWTQLLDARRYRSGWFVHSPGYIDVCSATVPTRPIPQPPK
ncbi:MULTISPECIES: peptidylprolyl isomerase [unclassified Roseateles]|uniref:peptidylprolyl isomerase n=1 Tax=unclassified Roseateles TaxID=2626991 RepID=UPI0006F49587|nr:MULTISPECIES: peptidylprolyl isomerase [unclassified Roseateles]KQW43495.1 peptidylprolyl isomerase [Pelomonas sp. Root405]KRA71233.1 peptidylprolyl isomerase [Pelomonas sp. Root662]